MTTGHQTAATLLVGVLLLTSGCLGLVTGDLSFDATEMRPTDDALDETGYEEQTAETQGYNRTVDLLGVEREISAELWSTTYTKQVTVQGEEMEAAAFGVVSMPAIEVAGEARNPLVDMNATEVLGEARSRTDGQYNDLRNLRHEETKQLRILGETRDVDVFVATTTVDGQEVEVVLHVAIVEDGDDVVVLFGGHPRVLTDEGVNVETLMESVERAD